MPDNTVDADFYLNFKKLIRLVSRTLCAKCV